MLLTQKILLVLIGLTLLAQAVEAGLYPKCPKCGRRMTAWDDKPKNDYCKHCDKIGGDYID